jgi:predicted transcriptional regulator
MKPRRKTKEPMTLTLTPEVKRLLALLAESFGESRSVIVGQLIREKAKSLNIPSQEIHE